MNPDTLASMTYKTGKIIPVTDDYVKEALRTIEDDLGFPHDEHPLKLTIIPERLQSILPINASLTMRTDTLATTSEQHEAVIYHEGVHYIMGRHGLLFAPDIMKGTFYDRLVDETVAELATSQRYGYNDMFRNDSGTMLANLRELVEILGKDATPEMRANLEDLAEMVKVPGEIITRHREIEDSYRKTQDLYAIEADVGAFFTAINTGGASFNGYSEAIRALATDNAKRMSGDGIAAKDLVESLADGVEKGWPAYAMYFVDIIGE